MRVGACDACLRRGHLIGLLAPRIGRALGRRERRVRGVLALDDEDLVAALCGKGAWARAARELLAEFDADAARRAVAEAGVETTCRHRTSYPNGLRDLPDAPAALFVAGGVERLAALCAKPAVAIVGARRATPYGVETAGRLGRELSAAGLTVVSGLALGIDGAAHRGALDGGGRPVAVLARGPERAYPAAHRALYRRVRGCGVVVSELPPGVPVHRWTFPARNRIMAALARMTVVVEAGEPSGSLITARFAADLGREVAAVPGRVDMRAAAGSNRLIRDGARVVLGAADILDELYGAGAWRRDALDLRAPADGPLAAAVLEAVEACDDLEAMRDRTGLAAAELRAALARLELDGRVVRHGAGYRRAPA